MVRDLQGLTPSEHRLQPLPVGAIGLWLILEIKTEGQNIAEVIMAVENQEVLKRRKISARTEKGITSIFEKPMYEVDHP